ncbi:secreted RxLR effector protein 161-like [Cicer arietinum]|uniref:secreted RxLR effector protein 161-like n=1 Tax=Cicer arietinum TaxID=3827 RepID=UPI003CC6280F
MGSSNSVNNPIVPGTQLSNDETGDGVDVTMFKQTVGSLMYLTTTRPDLMYRVSLISRFMANPKSSHWLAAKRILRYIKGTTDFGILYKRGRSNAGLVSYTDSNYAGDLDDRKSTSGFAFIMGSGAISWASKKQPIVSLSTTEAEYIAAAFCACQCVWLRGILEQLGAEEKGSTKILCDNNSTIQLSKNPTFHGRSKDLVNDGAVKLSFCSTEEQIADIMTKPLKLEQFVKLRRMLEVIDAAEV